MEHGYFGIGQYIERFGDGEIYTYDGRDLVTSTSAFHAADNSISSALPLHDLDLNGATWAGDALGFERVSKTAIFGSASLTVTGGLINPGSAAFVDHTIRVDINWDNGDSLQMDGEAGGINDLNQVRGDFRGSEYTEEGDEIYAFQGEFAGSQAEEALGSFRNPHYIGSFGVKKQ